MVFYYIIGCSFLKKQLFDLAILDNYQPDSYLLFLGKVEVQLLKILEKATICTLFSLVEA